MKRSLFWIVALVVLLAFAGDAEAQCSMCKAVVESNDQASQTDNVASVGGTINSGILYLMGMVYTVLMIMAYIFFRKPIQERLQAARQRG